MADNRSSKTLYDTLGVSSDVDQKTLKSAYRKLAKSLHPDSGSNSDEARFKDVTRAYDTLSDPAKRAEYDQSLKAPRTFPPTSERPPSPDMRFSGMDFNLEDLLRQFDYAPQEQRVNAPRPEPSRTTLTLSFLDALRGGVMSLSLQDPQGAPRSIQVRFPEGVQDGQTLLLRGKGTKLSNGSSRDLLVTLQVEPHPVFTRKGDDIHLVLPVSFQEAALGAVVSIPTPLGEVVKVRLTPGTANGKVLRVKAKGVPKSGIAGDMLATVEVVVPPELSTEARQVLGEYARVAKLPDPRESLMRAASTKRDGK